MRWGSVCRRRGLCACWERGGGGGGKAHHHSLSFRCTTTTSSPACEKTVHFFECFPYVSSACCEFVSRPLVWQVCADQISRSLVWQVCADSISINQKAHRAADRRVEGGRVVLFEHTPHLCSISSSCSCCCCGCVCATTCSDE